MAVGEQLVSSDATAVSSSFKHQDALGMLTRILHKRQ